MTQGFSNQEVQEALTQQWHPHNPPALQSLLILFSEESGIEVFAIVDEQGGKECSIESRRIVTVTHNAPFARAFFGKPVGTLITHLEAVYLLVGYSAELLPSEAECVAALQVEQPLRQAIDNMASRYDNLDHILGEQRKRLDEDRDTVRKAKICRIYLFEQDRWLNEEDKEQKRLNECLRSLRISHQRRQIKCLCRCYEHELDQLRTLELETATSVKREMERQQPLRKRRLNVLREDEQIRQNRERQRAERKDRESAKQLENERNEREREFNVWWAARHYGQYRNSSPQTSQAAKNSETGEKPKQVTSSQDSEVKTTPKIKPETSMLIVCPQCGCYIRPDRQEEHMTKKHGVVKSQMPVKPTLPLISSNFAAKVTQTEDIKRSSDKHDGSKGIGFLEREEGRFGSFPGHDDYEDESCP